MEKNGFGNGAYIRPVFVGVLVILVSLVLSGCFLLPRDTCTQGDTMTDPRVSGSFDASLPAPELDIVWNPGTLRGADLPSAYFDEVIVSSRTDPVVAALIGSVVHSAEREVTLTFIDPSSYLAGSDAIDFILEFPDRMGFIECFHPGSRDRYFLEVALLFDADDSLVAATFEQRVFLGPF